MTTGEKKNWRWICSLGHIHDSIGFTREQIDEALEGDLWCPRPGCAFRLWAESVHEIPSTKDQTP